MNEVKDYSTNTLYLFSGRIVFIISELIVGLLLARYLGPELFGDLAYILAIFYVLLAISKSGLDPIIIKFLVADPVKRSETLGSAFLIRFSVSILIVLLCIGSYFVGIEGMVPILILALVLLPSSLNVLNSYYQAIVRAKYQVYAEVGAKVAGMISKLLFIYFGFPFIVLIWIIFAEFLIVPILLIVFFKIGFAFEWQFSSATIVALSKQSWPMLLTGVAVILHMRIDQLMIKNLIDSTALGYYSAAIRLSESWYFIPGVITTSLFPKILEKAAFSKILENTLGLIYSGLMYLSLGIAIVISVFSESIVSILYGIEYLPAAPILQLYIWSGVFVSINYVSLKFYHVLNLERIKFLFTVVSLALNGALNYFFIIRYGVIGGALATLLSLFVSALILNLLYSKTRRITLVILKSLDPSRLLSVAPLVVNAIRTRP
ncbi:MAG: flippase [Saprospiraceae bacterium]|nr:flippase [Saprospiraceae bacterium]